MPVTESEPDACWACNRPLEQNQKFCLECKHWQGRRSYLTLSSSVLALLVALIAVLGFAIGQFSEFRDWQLSKKSEVYTFFSGVRHGATEDNTPRFVLHVLASNLGGQAVVLDANAKCAFATNKGMVKQLPFFANEPVLLVEGSKLQTFIEIAGHRETDLETPLTEYNGNVFPWEIQPSTEIVKNVSWQPLKQNHLSCFFTATDAQGQKILTSHTNIENFDVIFELNGDLTGNRCKRLC